MKHNPCVANNTYPSHLFIPMPLFPSTGFVRDKRDLFPKLLCATVIKRKKERACLLVSICSKSSRCGYALCVNAYVLFFLQRMSAITSSLSHSLTPACIQSTMNRSILLRPVFPLPLHLSPLFHSHALLLYNKVEFIVVDNEK